MEQRIHTCVLTRHPSIAQAKTGTGKTLGFLVPTFQRIIQADPFLAQPSFGRRGNRTTADDIRALIISPTRELAEQIAAEARKVAKNTGLIVQTAVGGTAKNAGLRQMQQQGCHVLVGTPGRLKDIFSDKYSGVRAPDLSALVFDEADRLLDQGFWPEIQEIMSLLPNTQQKDRQTLMFSATVPREVERLVESTLKPGYEFVKTVREDEEPTHQRVPQKVVTIKGFENSIPTLVELCTRSIEAGKQPGARPFKAIVYFNSTAEVGLASSTLHNLRVPDPVGTAPDSPAAPSTRRSPHPLAPARILEIHARLSQRQRTMAADDFRRCESGILLSSDVTARGMDFPNVTHVIQMGLPQSRDTYIHRIGRTARAGKEGEGWLVISPLEREELRYRLSKLPLKPDESLLTASVDMTREGQVAASAARILRSVGEATKLVPMEEKQAAYKALIGVYNWLGRKRDLVRSMNDLSRFGWGLKEPPTIPFGLAQKLGLARIEGVNLGRDREPRGGEEGEDRRGGGRYGGDRGRGGFGDRGRGYGEDWGRGGFGGDRGERGGYERRGGFNRDGGDRGFGRDRGDRGFGGGRRTFDD